MTACNKQKSALDGVGKRSIVHHRPGLDGLEIRDHAGRVWCELYGFQWPEQVAGLAASYRDKGKAARVARRLTKLANAANDPPPLDVAATVEVNDNGIEDRGNGYEWQTSSSTP